MASNVRWTVRLKVIDANGKPLEVPDHMTIVGDLDRADSSDFGLKSTEGKVIPGAAPGAVAQNQIDQMAIRNSSSARMRRAERT
jgi:hypothetical protein